MNQLPPLATGRARREQGHVTPFEGVEIPFFLVEGAAPGSCLLVTAGVHGSEYCSIEAALRLREVSPDEIRGTLLVLPILNVRGFPSSGIT